MTIEFRCGQCSQLLRVPDQSAGKNARCPKCQALMQVPAGPGAPEEPPPFPSTGGSPPPTFGSPPPAPAKSDDPFAFLNQSAPTAPLPPPPKPSANADVTPTSGVNPYASSPAPQGYAPQPYGYSPAGQQNPAPMILAVGSLLSAFMGLLSCACCLFLPFPAISLLMGIVALCIKPDKNAKIVAIIGIVVSVISLLLIIVGIIFGVVNAAMDPQFQQEFGN